MMRTRNWANCLTPWIVAIDRLSQIFGKLMSWFGLLMVSVTFSVVVLRYVFSIGSIALQELVIYLHASIFMLGATYTLVNKGHVRVDIFYRKLSSKKQALVDGVGSLLFLMPFAFIVLINSLDYVANSWKLFEGSAEPGGLPAVFVLKTLIPAFAVMLLIQAVAEVLRNIQKYQQLK